MMSHFENKIKKLEEQNKFLQEQLNDLHAIKKQLETQLDVITHSKTFIWWQRFNKVKKIIKKIIAKPTVLIKACRIFAKKGLRGLVEEIKNSSLFSPANPILPQYEIWFKLHYPTKRQLAQQKKAIKDFKYKPLISIITPTYNTPAHFLEKCIESVRAQSYDQWELCIADDASTLPQVREIIEKYTAIDGRIKVVYREKNGHICEASNTALHMAKGEYIALLDHDDVLWPNALYEVVHTLQAYPDAQFIYSDEDKLSIDGTRHEDPFFKPDWSPHYLRCVNYITHFAVLKRQVVEAIGGFRKGTEGAQDWDLFLRVGDYISKKHKITPLNNKYIIHIPTILYSWRKSAYSTASEIHAGKVKQYAYINQKKVLENDLKRNHLKGNITKTKYLGFWRQKIQISNKPLVSIIIPSKDHYGFITRCLLSIVKKTRYKHYEIVLVDTGSKEKEVLDFYKTFKKKNTNVRILKWDEPFNFAAVCNYGVMKARGEYIVLLNNDTEIITADWLEEMLQYAIKEEVGAVGAKLLYPDGRIQHAGVILGIRGGVSDKGIAGHAFKYFTNSDHGQYLQQMHSVKNYSAVTAACLMIKKEKYLRVGGQNEDFRIAFNDVDFCLKLLKQGLFNVYTPFANLYHYESVSVGKPEQGNRDVQEFIKEINLLYSKWSDILEHDPFYNKNLTKLHEDYCIYINET